MTCLASSLSASVTTSACSLSSLALFTRTSTSVGTRLPATTDYAPSLTLAEYQGPEHSEWLLRWEPPSAQGSVTIRLKGRKFGVSFATALAVTAVRVQGSLVLRWTPHADEPKLYVGFKRLPHIGFDVSLSGKALSLGRT